MFNAAGAYGHLGENEKETHILPLIFDAIKNNKVFSILVMIMTHQMVLACVITFILKI